MVEEVELDSLDDEVIDGVYWRWADEAIPVRSSDGWSLNVTDGRITRWSDFGGERRIMVEEWWYECFCAHFPGEVTIRRRGEEPIRLREGSSPEDQAPFLQLIGQPVASATLTDDGDLLLELEDGTTLAGRIGLVHCDCPDWELSPTGEGLELWTE